MAKVISLRGANLSSTASMKKWFFDRKTVESETKKGMRTALQTFGKYVRLDARRSMRVGKTRLGRDTAGRFKKTAILERSKPNSPPRRWGNPKSEALLYALLYYSYDKVTESVIIGSVGSNRRGGAPEVMEHGGYVSSNFYSEEFRRRYKGRFYVKPRPYMIPAFKKNLTKIPQIFKGVLSKRQMSSLMRSGG